MSERVIQALCAVTFIDAYLADEETNSKVNGNTLFGLPLSQQSINHTSAIHPFNIMPSTLS